LRLAGKGVNVNNHHKRCTVMPKDRWAKVVTASWQ